MKIVETVERECCDYRKDFLIYRPKNCLSELAGDRLRFCKHCGQVWIHEKQAGEMDYGWYKVNIDKALEN